MAEEDLLTAFGYTEEGDEGAIQMHPCVTQIWQGHLLITTLRNLGSIDKAREFWPDLQETAGSAPIPGLYIQHRSVKIDELEQATFRPADNEQLGRLRLKQKTPERGEGFLDRIRGTADRLTRNVFPTDVRFEEDTQDEMHAIFEAVQEVIASSQSTQHEAAAAYDGMAQPGAERTCPNCGEAASEGARFCANCGEQMPEQAAQAQPAQCPQCGQPLVSGARFCPNCGSRVGVSGAPDA